MLLENALTSPQKVDFDFFKYDLREGTFSSNVIKKKDIIMSCCVFGVCTAANEGLKHSVSLWVRQAFHLKGES